MDNELERLKRRRLMELQRRMLKKQAPEETHEEEEREPTPAEVLGGYFVGRAWEVYNAARAQYPTLNPQIEAMLLAAIKQGKVLQKIDGASLAQFYRQIGIPVRLNTKIRYSEHGELKTLEEKIKEK